MPVDDSWRNDPYKGGMPAHDYDSLSREYQRLIFGTPAQSAPAYTIKPKKCTCRMWRRLFGFRNCPKCR